MAPEEEVVVSGLVKEPAPVEGLKVVEEVVVGAVRAVLLM